jgi:hypothetical protein
MKPNLLLENPERQPPVSFHSTMMLQPAVQNICTPLFCFSVRVNDNILVYFVFLLENYFSQSLQKCFSIYRRTPARHQLQMTHCGLLDKLVYHLSIGIACRQYQFRVFSYSAAII